MGKEDDAERARTLARTPLLHMHAVRWLLRLESPVRYAFGNDYFRILDNVTLTLERAELAPEHGGLAMPCTPLELVTWARKFSCVLPIEFLEELGCAPAEIDAPSSSAEGVTAAVPTAPDLPPCQATEPRGVARAAVQDGIAPGRETPQRTGSLAERDKKLRNLAARIAAELAENGNVPKKTRVIELLMRELPGGPGESRLGLIVSKAGIDWARLKDQAETVALDKGRRNR